MIALPRTEIFYYPESIQRKLEKCLAKPVIRRGYRDNEEQERQRVSRVEGRGRLRFSIFTSTERRAVYSSACERKGSDFATCAVVSLAAISRFLRSRAFHFPRVDETKRHRRRLNHDCRRRDASEDAGGTSIRNRLGAGASYRIARDMPARKRISPRRNAPKPPSVSFLSLFSTLLAHFVSYTIRGATAALSSSGSAPKIPSFFSNAAFRFFVPLFFFTALD